VTENEFIKKLRSMRAFKMARYDWLPKEERLKEVGDDPTPPKLARRKQDRYKSPIPTMAD
jgi:hypothetical protein